MKEQADKERILDGQMQALEKAKGVEEVVQRGDYAHREIIEEQSR